MTQTIQGDYDVHDMAALLQVAAEALPFTSGMEPRPITKADRETINKMPRTELIQFMERALIQIHGHDDSLRTPADPQKTRFG